MPFQVVNAVPARVLWSNNPELRHTPSGSASRTFRGTSPRERHGTKLCLDVKWAWGRLHGCGRRLVGSAARGPGPYAAANVATASQLTQNAERCPT